MSAGCRIQMVFLVPPDLQAKFVAEAEQMRRTKTAHFVSMLTDRYNKPEPVVKPVDPLAELSAYIDAQQARS